MKIFFALLLAFLCCNCYAQIKLKSYRCKFYEDQWPNTMAEFCSVADTFRLTLYSRDIDAAVGNEPDWRAKSLQVGLDLAFGKEHYSRTKDSLYIATDNNHRGSYYYMVYVPDQMLTLSVRAANNDSLFSERSKWLLSQIRQHRKGDLYLVNDKGQTCQDPDADERVKIKK